MLEQAFVESVPESADAERVMRDMAGQGKKLIFATSFGYQEFVQKVAADLKDVKFEHATGYKNADNVATYDTKTFEGAYLFGGVTMLQFHLQATGVQVASQLLSMLPYLATIVVLVLISRNPTWIRANMPASLGKPFYPGS